MNEVGRGGTASDFYPGLIGDFIDVQDFYEAYGGFPAFEDTSPREGAARIGSKLLAFVSRRKVRQPGDRESRLAKSPYLWFYIQGEDRDDSFVVDFEMALEAVEKAVPAMDQLRIPVPAFIADVPNADSIAIGALRHLTLALVRVEGAPDSGFRASEGIRFEVAEEVGEDDLRPLYSFTMEPLTALLALGAPMFERPAHHPSAFERELDEFAAEVEAEIEATEKQIEEEE